MTDKRTQADAAASNTEKDPADWVTGDEPMTGAQRSYLTTLSQEAKVEVDENLTKAEASRRIDELQKITGRGAGGAPGASGSGSREGTTAGSNGPAASDSASPADGVGDDEGAPADELDFDGNGSRSRT